MKGFIALSLMMVGALMALTPEPAAAQVPPAADIDWLNLGGNLYGNGIVGYGAESFGMDVDAAGNTYVLLFVKDDATFTSTSGPNMVHPAPQEAMLLAKYDPDGQLLWVETVNESPEYESFGKLAVDAAGNAVVSGSFEAPTVVGTGSQAATLTSAGLSDTYMVKFDPSGQILWIDTEGGPWHNSINEIEMDSAGNIYLSSGARYDGAIFNGVTLPAGLAYVGYIAKYSPAGNLIWLTPLADDGNASVYDMDVSDAGVVVASGSYFYSPTFGTGLSATQLTNRGNTDMFVARFDATGTLDWAISGGGSSYDRAINVAQDQAGNVYTVGTGSTSMTLEDSSLATQSLSAAASNMGILWKLDAAGTSQWAVPFENPGAFLSGSGYAIDVDPGGALAFTGDLGPNATRFRSTDPAIPSVTVGSGDQFDRAAFIARWTTDGILVDTAILRGTDLRHDGNVAFGPDGGVHIVGRISGGAVAASDFPIDGQQDMFVAKLAGLKLCQGLVVTVDLGAGESPTDGDDVILGTAGADVINARAGDDTICAGAGNDRIVAGDGADSVEAGPGNDNIWGGAGDDGLYGMDGIDRIRGGAGNDEIWGGPDRDVILGEAGMDMIFGEAGRDSLYGGDDADTIDGGADTDLVRGQGDNDTLYTGPSGNDRLVGGDGDDILDARATTGSTRLLGEDGDDTFYGAQQLDRMWGGDGDDTMYGGGYNDLLRGGAGNDKIYGEAGRDTLDGGDGDDGLYGGGGDRDKMVGMSGSDTCVGGSGIDDFAHATCEAVA